MVMTPTWFLILSGSYLSTLILLVPILDRIEEWAEEDNLILNVSKSKEMIIRRP